MEVTLTHRMERQFAELQGRHGRKKSPFCLCEGVRCCKELLASPAAEFIELAVISEKLKEDFSELEKFATVKVSDEKLQKLSGTVTSQGVLILVKRPSCAPDDFPPPQDPFIMAVDKLGDPGNFGTILRTAKAAGLREFWFTSGSADPYQPKVIRSSLAAQFSMNLREFASLNELTAFAAQQGYGQLYLTDPHCGESCFECSGLFDRSVVVIGSEAHGIESSIPGNRVTIPMPGNFESLNAAQAATIVLFEHVRRLTTGKI
ncbi:MAG: RNA methyltransferase [Lentisphaerae bacterium]|nr:RNA methyltransferase [Lentisphaerota bacterium]